eukprot:14157988-Alexandrium_andersonii.AAC.1
MCAALSCLLPTSVRTPAGRCPHAHFLAHACVMSAWPPLYTTLLALRCYAGPGATRLVGNLHTVQHGFSYAMAR